MGEDRGGPRLGRRDMQSQQGTGRGQTGDATCGVGLTRCFVLRYVIKGEGTPRSFIMAVHISAHEVADARRQISVHDQPYILTDYIGAAPRRGQYVAGNERNDNGLPQGFLVDQPAGAVTQPHFHSHPQFQLVVDGSGRLGKHDVGFLDLHYVNGHTPYGPVAAGDGLLYFTLRRYWDAGAKYMPASRDLLVKGRQRTRYGGVPATATRRIPKPDRPITSL